MTSPTCLFTSRDHYIIGSVVGCPTSIITTHVLVVEFFKVCGVFSCTLHNVGDCEVALESRYFTAYGVPKPTLSDKAKVLKSKSLFCFECGIKSFNTTSYYHESSLT